MTREHSGPHHTNYASESHVYRHRYAAKMHERLEHGGLDASKVTHTADNIPRASQNARSRACVRGCSNLEYPTVQFFMACFSAAVEVRVNPSVNMVST